MEMKYIKLANAIFALVAIVVIGAVGFQIGVTDANNSISYRGYKDGYNHGHDISYNNGRAYGYYNGSTVIGIESMISRMPKTFNYKQVGTKSLSFVDLYVFLSDNGVDYIRYGDNFTCSGYAFLLKSRADAVGIKCGIARIWFYSHDINTDKAVMAKTSHMVNVFNVDKYGLTFVEPQDNTIFSLKNGMSYRSLLKLFAFSKLVDVESIKKVILPDIVLTNGSDLIWQVDIFWGEPFSSQLDYEGEK